jgi:hypothetical protein
MTVAANTGQVIDGLGLNGVSSFQIGALYAGALLQFNSANGNWYVIAGAPDTVVSVGGSVTAQAGQSLVAAPNANITLPAPTAPGAVITVRANGSVTASSPVTVSASSIYGVGLPGVTSFVLGTQSAFATLQSDGTAWGVIAGQQDTGWVALTLGSGISAWASGYTPSYRRTGITVQLSGTLQWSGLLGSGYVLASGMPAPAANVNYVLGGYNATTPSSATFPGIQVITNGQLIAPYGTGGGGSTWQMGLDGITYRLS